MTFKPNPGCDIPTPKGIPDVPAYLQGLVEDTAKRLIPDPTAKLRAQAATLTKMTEEYAEEVERRRKQLEQYANIVCPLPDVPDPDATSTFSRFGFGQGT